MTTPLSVRLVDLGACYGRRQALRGVTTPAFTGGEVVALIGPNGSGKSTLLKRMAGVLPGRGQVELRGAGPDDIGYLPQDTWAASGLTVYESVLVSARRGAPWTVSDSVLAQVDAMLAMLGLTDLAFRTLDALSGGQRQLASIAQSLVRQPRLLLMDEPTSALDLHRQLEVLDILRTFAVTRGAVVFISVHDVNLALRFADTAVVMAGGELRACGPSASVIGAELMRSVFHVEARVEHCSKGQLHVLLDGLSSA